MVYQFPWQEAGQQLQAFADTDLAGCIITRRSASGGLCMHGCHLIKQWAATP